MPTQTTVDEATVKAAEQYALDQIDEPLQREVIDPSAQQLYAAAQKYLMILNDTEKDLNKFKEILKQQKAMRHSNPNYKDVEAYQNLAIQRQAFLASDIPKKIFSATEEFQEQINAVLNQQVVIMFIFEDDAGNPVPYQIDKLSDILKYDTASRGYNLTARFQNMNNLATAATKIEASDDTMQTKMENLAPVYREVMNRYRDPAHHKWLMWRPIPPDVWYKMNISAEGDINEAYAAEIFSSQTDFMYDDPYIDNDIDVFATAIANVDNISGMLQGDVTAGNIEYAIKSIDASMPGLRQFKTMANQIIKDNGHYDVAKLQKKKAQLASKGKFRNHIYKWQGKAEEIAVDQVNQWMEEFRH